MLNCWNVADVDRQLFITADNELQVYIDGVDSEINTLSTTTDWQQTKVAKLPRRSRVIAVKVTDRGVAAGLLASVTGDYLLTDENWVVSDTLVDGWNKPEFDDSKWTKATTEGNHGVQPWGTRPQISSNAKWIWNKDTTKQATTTTTTLYFRIRLGTLFLVCVTKA